MTLANHDTEEERQRNAGEFDKVLEKRVNETKAEYQKRLDELAPFKTKFTDLTLDLAIREAAEKAGVLTDDLQVVVKIVRRDHVRLDERTGKAVVVDADGDVMGATVETFIAETFKAEYPKFFGVADDASGGVSGAVAIDIRNQRSFLANVSKIAKGEITATGEAAAAGGAGGGVDVRDPASILANVSKIARGQIAVGTGS
jgi:hypothetical protein